MLFDVVVAVVDAIIKQDLEISHWLMDMPVVHSALKKMRDRHCMHKVSCKQLAAGLARMHGQCGPKLFTVAANHCRGLVRSQVVEDVICY